MAEHNIPTVSLEAIPGPSTEGVAKSLIPSKNINISVPNKTAKIAKNKTRSVKMETMKVKGTQLDNIPLSHKRSTATIPITTERLGVMVMNSIKNMGKSDGASFNDISKYMEENHQLNRKLFDPCVKIFLKKGKEKGLLDRIDGMAGEERFKIKNSESVNKNTENLLEKEKVNTQIAELKNTTSMAESKNLRGKAIKHSPTSEITPSDQAAEDAIMTENLEAVPGPSSEQVAGTTSLHENTASVVSMKRKKNTERNTENKKLKTLNTETKEVKMVPENKNLKAKASRSKTAEMVLDAITSLKKRNGATVEDIHKYIQENKQIKLDKFKIHIDKFLKKNVENGTLEKLTGADAVEKYKIKK